MKAFTKILFGISLYFCAQATVQAQSADCLINFDSPFSLNQLYNQARDTFAVSSESVYNDGDLQTVEQCDLSDGGLCQYYFQFCGRGWFRVDPLEQGHYHLSGDGWDCYDFDTGGMGVTQGSDCVGPADSDYSTVPRTLYTHDSSHRIQIWQASIGFNEGTEPCEFDFLSIRILGDTAVRMEIIKENLTYTWPSIEPGHWNFSAWGEDALYVRLRSADGETQVIEIDDIRTRG